MEVIVSKIILISIFLTVLLLALGIIISAIEYVTGKRPDADGGILILVPAAIGGFIGSLYFIEAALGIWK